MLDALPYCRPFWPSYPEPVGWKLYTGMNSAASSYVFLMLKPKNNYNPELVMFGGFRAITASNPMTDRCFCNEPASNIAMRIKLDQASINSPAWNNAWQQEIMPGPRNGADSVVLPNGLVIIANGAAKGLISGSYNGGGAASSPVFEAW